jgi:alcohol dehydrogenase class IV
MKKLAEAFGVEEEPEPEAMGLALAERAKEIAAHLKVPASLKELGVPEGELPALAEECLSMYPRPNSPLVFDVKSMTQLYRRMWEGDLAP